LDSQADGIVYRVASYRAVLAQVLFSSHRWSRKRRTASFRKASTQPEVKMVGL